MQHILSPLWQLVTMDLVGNAPGKVSQLRSHLMGISMPHIQPSLYKGNVPGQKVTCPLQMYLNDVGEGVEETVGSRDAVMQQLPEQLPALPMRSCIDHNGPELHAFLQTNSVYQSIQDT